MSPSPTTLPPRVVKKDVDDLLTQCLTQALILQLWLRQTTDPVAVGNPLHDAIIVGLDVEWWEHDKNFITELGVSILDPRFMTFADWNSPWKVLNQMVIQHKRIKCNAHMVNRDICQGHPDDFEFGKTSFITIDGARGMLRCSFLRFDQHGCPRPVIFKGHTVENDAKLVKANFGLDIEALSVVVATIDTQVIAAETRLVQNPRKPKLSDLLAKFNIHEQYLHNGGDDIACTMIAAVLMCSPTITND